MTGPENSRIEAPIDFGVTGKGVTIVVLPCGDEGSLLNHARADFDTSGTLQHGLIYHRFGLEGKSLCTWGSLLYKS